MTLRGYQTAKRSRDLQRQLTSLDEQIIQTLATVGYASTGQLHALTVQDASPYAGARRIRRRTRMLEQLGVVYRLQRPTGGLGGGSSSSIWMLERAGMLIARPNDGRRDRRPARERGIAFVAHAVATTQHLVDLTHYARSRAIRIASWIGEPDCHVPYLDPLTGRAARLTPDAIVEVHTQTERVVSMVEVDCGSEGRISLEHKAGRYLTYAGAHAESPRVVWSFTTQERAQMFRRALDSAQRRPITRDLLRRGLFTITTAADAPAALCGHGGEQW